MGIFFKHIQISSVLLISAFILWPPPQVLGNDGGILLNERGEDLAYKQVKSLNLFLTQSLLPKRKLLGLNIFQGLLNLCQSHWLLSFSFTLLRSFVSGIHLWLDIDVVQPRDPIESKGFAQESFISTTNRSSDSGRVYSSAFEGFGKGGV